MSMWMNLDQLPADKSMYTVALTSDPVDTPPDSIFYDELDTVQRRGLSAREVVELVRDEIAHDYDSGMRVIGVSNQSDGYVMWEDPKGNLLD